MMDALTARDNENRYWTEQAGTQAEVTHYPKKLEQFVGWHWRCSCGYIGTQDMMTKHMADVGFCSECWGSGSDSYPSLGLCWECKGTGIPNLRRDYQLGLIHG